MMAARGGRPLLLIDIAVPRDIDPLCAEIEGVTLRDIDDLQAAVTHNLQSSRRPTCRRPRRSSRRRSSASPNGSARLDVRPTIAALHARGEVDRRGCARGERGPLGVGVARAISRASRRSRARSLGRLLHEPTVALQEPRRRARATAGIELLRDLFALRGDGDAAAVDAEQAAPDNVRELLPAGNP